MGTVARDDALRKKFRAYAKTHKLGCNLCFGDIDYSLRHPDPLSMVADHIVPLVKGGPDVWDNLQAAHRGCNRTKGSQSPDELEAANAPRQYVTSRTW